MPITFEIKRTPAGREYLQSLTTGVMDEAMTREFNEHFRAGGPDAGKPLIAVIAVIADDTAYTVESRKLFANGEASYTVLALVADRAPLRVMLNFMVKAWMVTNPRAPNVRTFASLEDAEAWLIGEVDGPAAR